MPNPKRKHSKSRRDKRRANWKLNIVSISFCPQCKEPKRPHYICTSCGYYNGEEIVHIKEKKKPA